MIHSAPCCRCCVCVWCRTVVFGIKAAVEETEEPEQRVVQSLGDLWFGDGNSSAKEARSGVTAQLTAQENEGRHAGDGQRTRGSWSDLISGRDLFFDLAQQDCDRAWVSFNSAPIWRRGSIREMEATVSQASRCTGPGLNCRVTVISIGSPAPCGLQRQPPLANPCRPPEPRSAPQQPAGAPPPHVTSATAHFPSPPWPIFKSPHQIIRFPPHLDHTRRHRLPSRISRQHRQNAGTYC